MSFARMSTQARFRGFDPISIVYLLTGLIVLLIVYLTIDSIRSEQLRHRSDAEQELKAVVDLATDDITRSLGSVRDSLRLLSRMPALRESHPGGRLLPLLAPALQKSASLFDRLEEAAQTGENRWKEIVERALDFSDLVTASVRRLLLVVGLVGEFDGPTAEDRPPGTPTPTALVAPIVPSFLFPCITHLRLVNSLISSSLEMCAASTDTAFSFGNPIPANLSDVEGLLRASLNDRDLIRSVAIQDLSGKQLLEATEIGSSFQMLGGWSRKAIVAGRPFYSGPVWFDEGIGKPVWQAAVPLRDLQRRPFGLLSSRVDLGFLQEMAAKSRLSEASHLLIVDEDGTVIGHPRPSQIAQQLNVSRSNLAVAEVLAGNDGIKEITIGGTSFLVAYRQLKNQDDVGLPGWGILYIAPSSDILTSFFRIAFNACVIAAIALYIVIYLAGMILNTFEEEIEA
ncbi:MAG: cache domain-containing protein [Candidatus Ozemobacteraceae bacterium]